MSSPAAKVYLYQPESGQHSLFFDGYSTYQGLRLLDSNPSSSVRVPAAYFSDSDEQLKFQDDIGTLTDLASLCHALQETWSLFDFSCEIDDCAGMTKLSTHDDCGCHFTLPTLDSCKELLSKISPTGKASQLWEALMANPGCYVCGKRIGEKPSVFPSFEAYLESLD